MKTKIAPTKTNHEIEHAVEAAVYLLSADYPVALPTETVYGLAGAALNPDALLRIFQVKERPFFDPLILHLPDLDWLDSLCEIQPEDRPLIEKLTRAFWPGPLTLVLPRKNIVPDLATSGLPTVAVRMSAHPIFQRIAKAASQPLAAPSANRFGRISPTSAAHVLDELSDRIHLIVDSGSTMHGVESTIISLRENNIWILRNGPITAEQLKPHAKVSAMLRTPSGRPNVPGQLTSHYAPRTPLRLLKLGLSPRIERAEPWGLLAFSHVCDAGPYRHIEVLSHSGDLREAAATFFSKLRKLDALGLDQIIAESIPTHGLGAAIMDRLSKAAGQG